METTIAVLTTITEDAQKAYRRRIFGWSMYDWADHGFITTSMVTFFPPYFIAIAAPVFLAAGKVAGDKAAQTLAEDTASNIFSLTIALALFIAALLAPIIGTYADLTGRRKRILIIVTALGSILASMMVTLTTGMWVAGLLLYAGTQIAVNVALGLNSSLLPHVARADDMDRVSSMAYALGFVGGGLLLAASSAMVIFADKLGIATDTAVRLAFLLTGIWWLVFMLPLAFFVPEPAGMFKSAKGQRSASREAFARLGGTLRDIGRYSELLKMLIAFWMYSEGISAIILLATAYGKVLGLDNAVLLGAILLAQFVGLPYVLLFGSIPNPANKWRSAYVSMLIWTAATIPFLGLYANLDNLSDMGLTMGLLIADQLLGIAFSYFIGRRLFANFAKRLTSKNCVLLGLVIFLIIPLWGFFLHTPAEFFMIAWLSGTVQGGVQALSRSIYGSLSPRAKSGEFFGIYGLSEKFAGILGPLLYGIIGLITHSAQASLLSIAIFFVVGIYTLRRVDVQAGAKVAAAEDAAVASLSVTAPIAN